MENGPFIDDFPIKTSIYEGFSMAMLNNQMVNPVLNPQVPPAWHLSPCTASQRSLCRPGARRRWRMEAAQCRGDAVLLQQQQTPPGFFWRIFSETTAESIQTRVVGSWGLSNSDVWNEQPIYGFGIGGTTSIRWGTCIKVVGLGSRTVLTRVWYLKIENLFMGNHENSENDA